jgi:hypothetical protein
MSRTAIAEHYLILVGRAGETPTARMYVRLAYKYGVPFGRIVNLSGLSAEIVSAYLEGSD